MTVGEYWKYVLHYVSIRTKNLVHTEKNTAYNYMVSEPLMEASVDVTLCEPSGGAHCVWCGHNQAVSEAAQVG